MRVFCVRPDTRPTTHSSPSTRQYSSLGAAHSHSELQAFARVLCRPTGTNLRFYPSNVMAIVNGVVQYGNGTMQLAATDGSSAAASAAAVAGASLVGSAATCAAAPVPPATAPAGPAAPYVCSATSVGNAVQLRTAAAALLNNTAEVVVISVTGNVSINASVWRGALALPRGLVLSLLGNPTAGQGVQVGGARAARALAKHEGRRSALCMLMCVYVCMCVCVCVLCVC